MAVERRAGELLQCLGARLVEPDAPEPRALGERRPREHLLERGRIRAVAEQRARGLARLRRGEDEGELRARAGRELDAALQREDRIEDVADRAGKRRRRVERRRAARRASRPRPTKRGATVSKRSSPGPASAWTSHGADSPLLRGRRRASSACAPRVELGLDEELRERRVRLVREARVQDDLRVRRHLEPAAPLREVVERRRRSSTSARGHADRERPRRGAALARELDARRACSARGSSARRRTAPWPTDHERAADRDRAGRRRGRPVLDAVALGAREREAVPRRDPVPVPVASAVAPVREEPRVRRRIVAPARGGSSDTRTLVPEDDVGGKRGDRDGRRRRARAARRSAGPRSAAAAARARGRCRRAAPRAPARRARSGPAPRRAARTRGRPTGSAGARAHAARRRRATRGGTPAASTSAPSVARSYASSGAQRVHEARRDPGVRHVADEARRAARRARRSPATGSSRAGAGRRRARSSSSTRARPARAGASASTLRISYGVYASRPRSPRRRASRARRRSARTCARRRAAGSASARRRGRARSPSRSGRSRRARPSPGGSRCRARSIVARDRGARGRARSRRGERGEAPRARRRRARRRQRAASAGRAARRSRPSRVHGLRRVALVADRLRQQAEERALLRRAVRLGRALRASASSAVDRAHDVRPELAHEADVARQR